MKEVSWVAIAESRLAAGLPCAAETKLDMNRPHQQATRIPPATSRTKRGYILALRCLRVVFRHLGILLSLAK